MGASNCESCGAEGKTYWVGDKHWLCGDRFKKLKGLKSE